MKHKYINSNNPFEDTFNELQLFQQTSYCIEYLKIHNGNKTEQEILTNAEIASACFRQANEFILAAQNVSLATSPLLYSYALNNYAKGMTYLLTFDQDKLSYFKQHGFKVDNNKINDNILTSEVSLQTRGVPTAILEIFGNHILSKQNITFDLLLSQIPELAVIYLRTTHKSSNTAKRLKNEENEYISKYEDRELDVATKKDVFEEYGFMGDYYDKDNEVHLYLSMKTKKKIKDNPNIENNLYYKEYLIMPNQFTEGIIDINLMFYCYLLIMSYGMLVRYNAHKWEKFIDSKLSNEFTLIKMSVNTCVNNFIILLHQKLFGYMYVQDKYDDFDVKKVIKESTKDIMNDITKTLKQRSIIFNEKTYLPWDENIR